MCLSRTTLGQLFELACVNRMYVYATATSSGPFLAHQVNSQLTIYDLPPLLQNGKLVCTVVTDTFFVLFSTSGFFTGKKPHDNGLTS